MNTHRQRNGDGNGHAAPPLDGHCWGTHALSHKWKPQPANLAKQRPHGPQKRGTETVTICGGPSLS